MFLICSYLYDTHKPISLQLRLESGGEGFSFHPASAHMADQRTDILQYILSNFIEARACAWAGRDYCAIMPADLEKYRAYVDQFDLSETQKAELIHTVWAIMESFVDHAFGIDPVQQCLEVQARSDSPANRNNLDSSDQAVSKEFIQSATGGEKR